MCRTYWHETARHYRVAGNDARVATGHECAGLSPGILMAQIQRSNRRNTPIVDPLVNESTHAEIFDTRSADTVPAQIQSD